MLSVFTSDVIDLMTQERDDFGNVQKLNGEIAQGDQFGLARWHRNAMLTP